MKILFKLSLVAALLVFQNQESHAQRTNAESTTEKFNTLLYYIEHMYVDSVDSEELVATAIRKMLEELDPHSVYISKEELKEVNEPLNGNFEGIGVQFNILKDTIFIVSPIIGGPSEKLGIVAGDKIITINGENVAGIGITNPDVMSKLKGPKGTQVNVGIKRKGAKELIEFPIIRDKIPIYSVDASYMAEPGVGYIKISRFAKTTTQELRDALQKLNSQGMQTLVLDLQNNGGGLLNSAIEMSDEFLSGNKLLVYTEGRAFPKEESLASHEGLFEKGKLIVLIDEGSASASEIVTGAVQDWDRGMVIGRRSFGKGLVQRPVSLPDGSAVRLTVQKYYTPVGRCIQKPYEEGSEAYQREKYERFEKGELFSLDSLNLPDSLKYFTKVKKRAVYGGGGILPDIFVPIDTSMNSTYYADLVRNGVVNSFCLTYADQHRAELLKTFANDDDFVKRFEITKDIMDKMIAQGVSSEVPFVAQDFETSKRGLELRMKALIGRNLYEPGTFYKVINVLNPAYMKALEVLKDGTFNKMKLASN
jgi:carboxyl-terminal processing protease